MSLDNRVAIVTGAGSGIGAATARTLAQRGAHVALVDVNEAPLERLAKELPVEAIAIGADVSSEADIERYTQMTLSARSERSGP